MATVITSNLEVYYNSRTAIGNNLFNISPNNVNNNNPSLTDTSLVDGALYFSGEGANLRFQLPSHFRTIGSPFTLEILISMDDTEERLLFGESTYVSIASYGIWFEVYSSNSWEDSIGHEVYFTANPNQDIHFVASYDPTDGNVRYYIDGSLINTEAVSSPILLTYGNYLTFGHDEYSGDTGSFKGTLSVLRLYSKALTQEITSNYNIGREVVSLPEEEFIYPISFVSYSGGQRLPIYNLEDVEDTSLRIKVNDEVGCFNLVDVHSLVASPFRIMTKDGIKSIAKIVSPS